MALSLGESDKNSSEFKAQTIRVWTGMVPGRTHRRFPHLHSAFLIMISTLVIHSDLGCLLRHFISFLQNRAMPLWKCVEEKSPRPPCASHPDVGQVKN
jgi:hypothetical protein